MVADRDPVRSTSHNLVRGAKPRFNKPRSVRTVRRTTVGSDQSYASQVRDPVVSRKSNCMDPQGVTRRTAVQCCENVTFLMTKSLDPFRFLLIGLSGLMNQQQLQLIDYLREENRVLCEQLGKRRLRFSDDQRRRLAVGANGLGSKLLRKVTTIVTLETLWPGVAG